MNVNTQLCIITDDSGMQVDTNDLVTISSFAKAKDISITYVKKVAKEKGSITIVTIDGIMFVDLSKTTFERVNKKKD